MPKFKVGDVVRRLPRSSEHPCIPTGSVGKVLRMSGIHIAVEGFNDPGDPCPYYEDNFELVSLGTESELERLVAAANAGYRAIERLDKEFSTSVQYREKIADAIRWTEWCDGETFTQGREIRIKPKFEAFQVGGNQWPVVYDGQAVTIGCQKFDSAYVLQQALKSAVNAQSPVGIGGSDTEHQVRGGQHGVYWKTFHLSWEDANKIINALDKAGVK